MTSVTYIEHNGTEHTVELAQGTSIMQGAVDNMIEGIVGECGGGLACATCHCYVDEAWIDKTVVALQAIGWKHISYQTDQTTATHIGMGGHE